MVQFIAEVNLYIVKETERRCCTCAFWMGIRTSGEDGFVYSLQELEGACKQAWHAMEGATTVRVLKLPDAVCSSWRVLPETA